MNNTLRRLCLRAFFGNINRGGNETGSVSFSLLEKFEMQKEYAFDSLVLAQVAVSKSINSVQVSIPINNYTIKQQSRLVTDYYCELILLYGDPTKDGGLETDSVISKAFATGQVNALPCQLTISLPQEQWVAFLKVTCIEGNELAAAPKNYAMRVVGVG